MGEVGEGGEGVYWDYTINCECCGSKILPLLYDKGHDTERRADIKIRAARF